MNIDALMRARSQHISHLASTRRMDNFSDFECSCGLLFVADSLSNLPRGSASMVAVHTAEMTLLALGLPTGVVVEDLTKVGQPPAGAIIKSAEGVLLQWNPCYSGGGHFRSPSGERFDLDEVASPVTVLWSPPGDDGEIVPT